MGTENRALQVKTYFNCFNYHFTYFMFNSMIFGNLEDLWFIIKAINYKVIILELLFSIYAANEWLN